MLNVLLVDDEPFILQGLQMLIDWNRQGYEIVHTASNGQEALEYLRKQDVDLIISDIRMPQMDGLELLELIRKEEISKAYYVVLSGYAEFSYAQKAMQYNCTEYIVKPVERENLLHVLEKVRDLRQNDRERSQNTRKMEQAYLARNLIALIQGKFDRLNEEYVAEHLTLCSPMSYVELHVEEVGQGDETSDLEKRSCQRQLFLACQEYLREDSDACIFDVSSQEKVYDIGVILCEHMIQKRIPVETASGREAQDLYLEQFLNYLDSRLDFSVVMLVGKKVNDLANLAKSYGTACKMRFFQGFREKKAIYYYEDEMQISSGGIILCKKSIDHLITVIEENEAFEIRRSVDALYQEMQQMGITQETMNLNINYLLFQMIHLATEQDSGVNQEEVLRTIIESTFEEGILRGSKTHLSLFACEYANYLAQLRKNVSRGVIGEIEREIRNHYPENLTLKGLSEKYYVNSAYLGQLFRKKYKTSFKDYLNNYRIEQAATMLLRTDQKVYQIAEAVGYKDIDYFVNRFITAKGCTPAKYRKQAIS